MTEHPVDFPSELAGHRTTYRFDGPCGLDMPPRLNGSMPACGVSKREWIIDGLSERQENRTGRRTGVTRQRIRRTARNRAGVFLTRRVRPFGHWLIRSREQQT
jgi:hypothetical protein